MHPTHAVRWTRRAAYSLLEVGIAIGLVGLVSLWALPRFVGGDEVIADSTAQAHADLAVEAALAARRDLGVFDDSTTTLEVYTSDVTVQAGDTLALATGEVSVTVVSPGASLSEVRAAAVTDDGTCWMTRRTFGTDTFEVLYGYQRGGVCNADRATALVPAPGDPEQGSRWSRPLEVAP